MNIRAHDSDTLSILACQLEIPPTPTAALRDAHLANSVEKVRAKIASGDHNIDLVVLPELSTLEYGPDIFSSLSDLAEPLDGPSFKAWRQLAIEARTYVCYSFARKAETGFFICASVVAPDGELLGHYDKLHLAQFGASSEKDYFQRGDHLYTFEIRGFKLSTIICYDIRIPELARTLVIDHNVDAILHCGAYYRDESFHTWHSFAITRSIENQVFLLSLNRAGLNFGKSLFCPPWQDEKTRPLEFANTEEDFQEIRLDRRSLLDARQNFSFLKDRLPDYQSKILNTKL